MNETEKKTAARLMRVANAAGRYLDIMTWSPSVAKAWKPGDMLPDHHAAEVNLRKALKAVSTPEPEMLLVVEAAIAWCRQRMIGDSDVGVCEAYIRCREEELERAVEQYLRLEEIKGAIR